MAAKKAKDPILLQLNKEGLIMAVSRLTLYVVNEKAEMKTTSIKHIEKVAMGADGGSMVCRLCAGSLRACQSDASERATLMDPNQM